MKPKDLVPSHSSENPKIVLEDGIWYIPKISQDEHSFFFPGWESPDIFGNCNPVNIEYCSGNGAWITEQAAAQPHVNWVAVERKFQRVRKIWSKMKNLSLKNLLVVWGEAFHATRVYFKDASIQEIYINFPDPWPKNKHSKHRLVQPCFVEELERVLIPEGSLTIVTDDKKYSEQIIPVILEKTAFTSEYPHPYYQTELPGYGSSYFEQLWLKKGKTIRYHKFTKRTHGNH